jgi:uncharacterized protein YraI
VIHSSLKKILHLASLSSCFLLTSPLYAQQEMFPFVAEVTAESVNVRAGQSTNFERLCRLTKGDEVVVSGRSFSWYQIQLPPDTKVYISDKYVRLLNRQEGRIESDDVNVRAGAGIHHTILGQLPAGARVRILQKIQEWYQIEAPPSVSGWISDKLVSFKSRNVSAYRPAQPTDDDFIARGQPIPGPSHQENIMERPRENDSTPALEFLSKMSGVEKIKGDAAVAAQGVLEPLGNVSTGPVQYQIIVDGRPAYYLSGLKHIFDKFAHQRVSVEGELDTRGNNAYPHPVVLVSKIQLIF